MINLARDKNCDATLKQELTDAGIPIVKIDKTKNEVPANYIGALNGFQFVRGWYYWMVSGAMPLDAAKEIYAKYKNLAIRVAGHCGNPPPEEWCEPLDYQEKVRKLVNDNFAKPQSERTDYQEIDRQALLLRSNGPQFVLDYHIDTQEGLNAFAAYIKEHDIQGLL